ncbi:MAG: prepilin peptidase [Anaerolineaceae bacterium]|nr:prepilin peptidase [Anaerolineaceae bacterium]
MQLIINAFVGVIVGIIINYFSDVLPVSRRISRPLCKGCNQPYSLKDYLVKLKCSNCGKKPSLRSIIVLLSSVAICILLNFFPFSILGFWATLPILAFLGTIMVIDIEHKLVLFETSIFGFVLLLIYGLILRNWLGTIIGALIGFLIMLLFYYLGKGFTKLLGKLRHQEVSEVAFGFGDVFAGTFLGLLAGPSIIGAIFLAMLAFGAFSLVLILALLLSKRYRSFSNAQPFAPFLILGVIATFYLQGF